MSTPASPRSARQILFALLLLAGNTVYASQILQMSRPFATGEPGPSFLPALLCGFVYVAVLCILSGELRKPSAAALAAAEGSEHVPRIGLLGPVLAIALTASFIIGFLYVGYLPAAFVYTALIAGYFNYEESGNCRRAALIGVVTGLCVTLFGWLFFVQLFDLYLPLWEF
ncbi:tripartite tricarboxylate transporter TctB family protein [Alloyangia pacifica]|uniref:Tripartite tricarboxylate transporter TctB family protein n=1 Tax=Alloyangia pacifica TaxID=311180 RepID=A0A1I6SX83_9RHOB|nr:tripartite tricarboxylate transporter TctB family protein [Alloyangia pacifica]SDG90481.1 Tripartite tricarboxylate transporter TctB family protein [Alloyangia pacifica]SFS81575.1 Tripartite tricarboxylate transporter TctB family protein [Alloyangia pacifica]